VSPNEDEQRLDERNPQVMVTKEETKKRLIIKACDSRIHVTILGFLLNKFLSGIL